MSSPRRELLHMRLNLRDGPRRRARVSKSTAPSTMSYMYLGESPRNDTFRAFFTNALRPRACYYNAQICLNVLSGWCSTHNKWKSRFNFISEYIQTPTITNILVDIVYMFLP